jgi:hypothetical protein
MDVFRQRVQGRDFSMHLTFFDLQALHPEDTLCLAADRRSFCTFIFGCSLFIFYRKQRAEFGGPTVLLLIIKQHIFFRIHYYGILLMANIIIPVHRRDRNGGATPLVILDFGHGLKDYFKTCACESFVPVLIPSRHGSADVARIAGGRTARTITASPALRLPGRIRVAIQVL